MEISQALALLVVSLAAALLPALSRMLRIPSPVAEILFGVGLGVSLLNVQIAGHWLPFLAELGFLVLMFQAGMEIDFRLLTTQPRGRMVGQVALFALTVAGAATVSLALGRGMFMTLVLSTTSLGLVMPVLREGGASQTDYGQTVLVAATLADFLTLLGITFFVLWRTDGGLSWHFLAPVGVFAGFAVLLWAGRMWAWWYPERAERLLLSSNVQEQGVRLALALLFLLVAISELAGVEPVLGAFMGGCVVSFVLREKHVLESKISALGFGFLIPIFFIHVGMGLDVSHALEPSHLILEVQLLAAAFAVKVAPCLFLLPPLGFAWREALRAGLLLSSRLSLIVAAASIGLREGLLDVATKDAIVLLALFTCLLGPTLARAVGKGGGRNR